jgi:folate-binding protein YgfZ
MSTTLPDRSVFRLSGAGVRDFLQGLITNDVLGALPIWAGLLTPQGKALFDFIVWADDATDDLLIDCEARQEAALVRRLSLYRLRRPISIAVDEGLAVHWAKGDVAGVADPRTAALGHRWIAPPTEPATGYHAHRLALSVVEGVAELGSDQSLWLECNAEAQHGVSFIKGCYIGQENTARMHHRDKLRKRLAVVKAEVEPEGARVWYPDLGYAVVVERIADQK